MRHLWLFFQLRPICRPNCRPDVYEDPVRQLSSALYHRALSVRVLNLTGYGLVVFGQVCAAIL
jgi:hypothetical protein